MDEKTTRKKRRRVSRENILDGASEILNEGTYSDLTVDALARAMKMSKSTLYKHFISKQAVIEALIGDVCSNIEGRLAGIRLDTPERMLDDVIEVLAEYANRVPAAAIVQHDRLPKSSQLRVTRVRGIMAVAVENAIAAGTKDGTFAFGDPELAADVFVASAFSAMDMSSRRRTNRGDAVRSLKGLLLPGLIGTK